MGNNPSKGPVGDGPSPATSGTTSLTASTSDKRAARGPVHNRPPGTNKAPAADLSAAKETATGQSPQNQAPAHQRLQSRHVAESPTRPVDRPDHHEPKKTEVTRSKEIPTPDPSNPVQVPVSRAAAARRDPYEAIPPSDPPHKMYYSASHHLQRPPRMPLPIGDATATPGSPISDPDYASPVAPDQAPSAKTTTAQPDHTTIEDDDTVDELHPYANSAMGRAVPTTIEWTAGGNKVYVTGTFVNWEKKFRLHKSENKPGVLAAKLNLRPGTHHLKFIVDGEMRASDNLPTAVDFTNHLVNYIELGADDASRSRRESDKAVPPGVHPPQVLPDEVADGKTETAVDDDKSEKEEEPEEIPIGDFRGIIPQFLLDLDKEEESACYQQAVNIIGDAPTPPSLPLFLGKSILNGTTPMKDDSSLLNNPNHTVLNHLATSSIKNGVLATSVTTRYKRKVRNFITGNIFGVIILIQLLAVCHDDSV
ncbi:putative Snf1 kinase complex beta-subunit Gal83 [Aspergillus undulatus]|uniref:putative Snf1 kinase complex beta-subunit Gal83 n=1 Tax=Aspergillus undulatus TaxID=1810928 RepID=UPI003CCCD4D7